MPLTSRASGAWAGVRPAGLETLVLVLVLVLVLGCGAPV